MTATLSTPIPLIGWDADDDEWLDARRTGISASEVGVILGFSPYTTPWQIWADKTGRRHPDDLQSEAIDIGIELEPWLIGQVAKLIGQPVVRTSHRLYAHPQHRWRMCSPDATTGVGWLVETKTSGLASGWGTPAGWTAGGVPLLYELQVRWQMHVMDAPGVYLGALVAGMGRVVYEFPRDHAIEADLVAQVSRWRDRHLVAGIEPPLGASDAAVLAELFPAPTGSEIDLDDTDAANLCARYLDALHRERAAGEDKERLGAELKALLATHEAGRIGGRTAVTWRSQRGNVNWSRLAQDMARAHDLDLPDPDSYRHPSKRVLRVQEIF